MKLKDSVLTAKDIANLGRINLAIADMTDDDWDVKDDAQRAKALAWARKLIDAYPCVTHVVLGWVCEDGKSVSLNHPEAYNDIGFFGNNEDEGSPAYVRFASYARHMYDLVVHAKN